MEVVDLTWSDTEDDDLIHSPSLLANLESEDDSEHHDDDDSTELSTRDERVD